jgi:excisionase family DNA binding protein
VPPHLRELSESLPLTLSPDEVAKVLQVTSRTVRRMVATGELHAVRSIASGSARYIIPRSELIRWMAERGA